MSKINSTVIIKNGKIVFSKEILNYFENLRTEENSKWIDKYFDILSDESNINSTKFEVHHIIPCFTFKDENHKNRKETISLANEIKENLINLSIHNHILAHYYLWKIFKNKNSKIPIQLICNNKRIKSLTENQIKEIALILEEYSEENITEDEKKEWYKEYRKNNKDKFSEYFKQYNEKNKDKLLKQKKEYYENNRDRLLENSKEYYKSHKIEKSEYDKEYRKTHMKEHKEYVKKYTEINKDKIKENRRKYRNEHKKERKEYDEKYKKENKEKINNYKRQYRESNKEKIKMWQDKYITTHKEILKECRDNHKEEKAQYDKKYREINKDKIKERNKITYEKNKEKISKMGKSLCYDPIRKENCTFNSLKHRKSRYKELYNNINPTDYIIE